MSAPSSLSKPKETLFYRIWIASLWQPIKCCCGQATLCSSGSIVTDIFKVQYLSVTFLRDDKKVQVALSRLDELTKNEQEMVIALTFSSVKKLDKGMEQVASSLSDSKKERKEEENRRIIQEHLDSKALDRVLEMNEAFCETRLAGTGDWVLEETLLQQWIDPKSSLLWILAGPRAGKSYLSSRIIQSLKDLHPQGVQVPEVVSVGFFYIKEDDQQLRSINTLLKSVAYQVAQNDPAFRKNAINVCAYLDNIRTARGTWKRLFLDFFGSSQNDNSVFIVVDGLDEAPKGERATVLDLLGDLVSKANSSKRYRIRILLVGRPELQDDIQSYWEDRAIRIRRDFIEVSAQKNTKDILEYVTIDVRRVRLLHKLPIDERRDFRQEIIEKLQNGANGMFL